MSCQSAPGHWSMHAINLHSALHIYCTFTSVPNPQGV
ncbi:unnamed protein product, partial [Staurois parvus]